MKASILMPEGFTGNKLLVWTNSNWGPQDASKPKENKTRTVRMQELQSIQGFYITRMGGPIFWGLSREKHGSRSLSIAESKAIDEGIKGI